MNRADYTSITGYNGISLSDSMCTDNTNGCQAPGFRPFLMNSDIYNDQSNKYKGFLCINQAFWDGTLFNSLSVPQYVKYDDFNATFGSCGQYGSMWFGQETTNIAEGQRICTTFNSATNVYGAYSPSVHACNSGYFYFTYNNVGYCGRTIAPVNCPIGSFCVGNVTTICPIDNYCQAGAQSPTPCPINTTTNGTTGASNCSNITCPIATVVCDGGNTNSAQVGISYLNLDGTRSNLKNASPGTTVIVQIPYDNKTDRALSDVSIKTALPSGFQYVDGSFRTCKIPTIAEYNCDNKTALERDNMFTTMIDTGLSPSATFYDGVDTGANGTATLSTKGILDAGKKRYLNLNSCHYENDQFQSRSFDILLDDGTFGSSAPMTSNTAITSDSCRTANVTDPLNIQYTRK
jgi:hypothetical protein